MKKELKICTAIRNKEYEDRVIFLSKTQGWKHSFVNIDNIHQQDSLFFIVEDSYSSILELIELHNSVDLNFIPVIIVSENDSKRSNWIKAVKYPEKYFQTSINFLNESMVQIVKTMDTLRDTYYYKRISIFRENISSIYKNGTFQEFTNEVLSNLLKLLYADRGSIMLLNEKNNLVIEASSKKELNGLEVSYKPDTVAWTVIDTQKPVFVENIDNDPRFKKGEGYSKDYFLSIPIFVDGKIAGVLNLSDKIISLLFDTSDYNNANYLLSIVEPYLILNYLKKQLKGDVL